METTVTFTIDATAKTCRLTDTTDYTEYGLSASTNQMKLLGIINFQGEPLYSKLTVGDPLINLQSGATYFEFPAELDSTGAVAYGVYSLTSAETIAVMDLTETNGTDDQMLFPSYGDVAAQLTVGDTIDIPSGDNEGTVTIAIALDISGFLLVGVDEELITEAGTDIPCTFHIAPVLNQSSWTYAGCTQVTGLVNLTSDCNYGDNGTWSVYNTTVVTTQTLVSTDVTINYPSWTGEAAIEVTTLPYTNNRLATGTYSVVAAFVYSQVENDGLIIQYTAECTSEFIVRCAQPLCNLNSCIENLRVANNNAIVAGKVSPYQATVDNVMLLWVEAQNYLACGELSNYQTTVEAIQAQLDSSGCDCDCCDDDELRWVYNTSEAAQTAIETLQTEVLALQNPTVYNKVIFDSVFPIGTASTIPGSPDFYRPFTDISAITIAKEYFAPNTNGYPKNYIQIEMDVNLFDTTYTLVAENVENSTNILGSLTATSDQGQLRLVAKIYTYENGTSGIYQITDVEGFLIDQTESPTEVTPKYYVQNSGLSLWNTDEDLVLDFTPADTTDMCITQFKITAIAIP